MNIESSRGLPAASSRRRAASRLSVALLLAVTALAAGCSSKSDVAAPAADSSTPHNVTMTTAQRSHLQFYTVAKTSFQRMVTTSGVVDFDNDQATSVLAPFSGPVSRLLVATGDHVSKGQPLALVDSPDFAAAISGYAKALATARNARRLADTDKDLVRHDGVAQREAEQAQTDAANADADRDAALQALLALNVDKKTIKDIQAGRPAAHVQAVIRSPVSGIVVERQVTPGQLLQAGSTPCFSVADLSRVWVNAQVFSADLSAVKVGDPADVEVGDAGKVLPGKVSNVAAEVDPDTRAVIARVVVDNPGDMLKKQMYVRVKIHSRTAENGLLVPVSAILRDDDNLPFVYVLQADGSFAQHSVTLGYRLGDRYDIRAGLKPGDRIVVDGAIFVRFMQNQ